MNLEAAAIVACQEPTLVDAITWICNWECDRAVRQALKCEKTGKRTAAHGGKWDTCFRVCLMRVMKEWEINQYVDWLIKLLHAEEG